MKDSLTGRPRVWRQSIARAHLLGESSMNPSLAARSLLGEGFSRKQEHVLRRYRRGNRRIRNNPAAALLGALGGGLFSGAGRVSARRRADAARLLSLAMAGDRNAADSIELHAGLGWAGFPEALAALQQHQQRQGDEAAARAARTPAGQIGRGLASLGESPLALGIGTALARGGRSGLGRTRITYDQFGNPRRTRVPQGAGGGASGLRGLATAGVAIGGLAAGYYIGSELNSALVARAPNAEEAGVRAALAFRRARAAAAARKGAPLSPAEVRALGDEYKRQLVELGYDPTTFTRRRNVVERFFTGEEEG